MYNHTTKNFAKNFYGYTFSPPHFNKKEIYIYKELKKFFVSSLARLASKIHHE